MGRNIYTVFLAVFLPCAVFGRTIDLKDFYRGLPMANLVCVDKPADIAFVLDESSSIYYKDFHSQSNFVMNLAPRFNIEAGDIRISVMTFSDTTNIRFHLGEVTTLAEMNAEMKSINSSQKFGDQTRTFDAIRDVREKVFSSQHARENVAHIVVLITDGESSDFDRTSEEADKAREAGITMFAIGVGKNLKKELNAIANDPDEDFVFEVDNYDVLEEIANKLVEKTCTVITTTPPPSIEGCDEIDKIDVIFSLPDHAGIEGSAYATEFVNSFVAKSNYGRVRVGVTPGPCYPSTDIPLSAHNSKADFIMALNTRMWTTADVHSHIDYIANEMSLDNGGNVDVLRFGILIIDSRLSNRQKALKQAEAARDAGIHLLVIGVGDYVDDNELEDIGGSDQNVFYVSDYSQLQTEIDLMVGKICDDMDEDYEGHYDYPLK